MWKFKVLLAQSLTLKIKKRSFYITTIVTMLAIIALINVPAYLLKSVGDTSSNIAIYSSESENVDNYLQVYETQSATMLGSYTFVEQEVADPVSDVGNEFDAYINLDENKIYTTSMTSIPSSDILILSSITSILNQQKVIAENNLDPLIIQQLYEVTMLESVVVDAPSSEDDANTLVDKAIASGLNVFMIMPIFLLITFITQIIGLEIADEKASRGMEIIVSNVSSKVHMLAKIVSASIYVVIQIIIIITSIFIGFAILNLSQPTNGSNSDFAVLYDTIINYISTTEFKMYVLYYVVLLLVAVVLYSMLIAIVTSRVTSSEDIQKITTPVMLILIVGFYYALLSGFLGDLTTLNMIVGFIPLYNALIAPTLYLTGVVGNLYMILNILFSAVVIVIVFITSQSYYKRGLLNYSNAKKK